MTKIEVVLCCERFAMFKDAFGVEVGPMLHLRSHVLLPLEDEIISTKINFCPWCGSRIPKVIIHENV